VPLPTPRATGVIILNDVGLCGIGVTVEPVAARLLPSSAPFVVAVVRTVS
jgi:hypothetical protein